LVDERHRECVHTHVDDAVRHGVHVLAGGEPPPEPGPFYRPTVPTGCTPDMLVMREEAFGPIAPVRLVPDFAAAPPRRPTTATARPPPR
jgi:acyl-CoA reductase-like NAD-dependent aldehyde dehydrogenase